MGSASMRSCVGQVPQVSQGSKQAYTNSRNGWRNILRTALFHSIFIG